MSIEALFYGWLPGLFAIGSLAGSTLVSWKTRSAAHCCLSVIVFACVFWSLFTLYRIFVLDEQQIQIMVLFGRTRWNVVPHFIILAAFSIFAAQGFYVFSRRTNAAS